MEFDARMQQSSMKQKIERLDGDLKRKIAECEKLTDDLQRCEKLNRNLLQERDKQKVRIAKLISRKGKFDS